jgi:hypothetical protein
MNHLNPSIREIYLAAQPLLRRDGKKLGSLVPGSQEDDRFRGAFGSSVSVVADAWRRIQPLLELEGGGGPNLQHFLSSLMFLYVYPKNEKTMCILMGGIDPKTMHKRIDPYHDALFELNYSVVSDSNLILYLPNYTNKYSSRFVLKIGLR